MTPLSDPTDPRDMHDREPPHMLDSFARAEAAIAKASDPPAEWVSVSDYARTHSVSRNTVRKWMRARLLEFYKVDVIVRIKNVPPDQQRHAQDCSSCKTSSH